MELPQFPLPFCCYPRLFPLTIRARCSTFIQLPMTYTFPPYSSPDKLIAVLHSNPTNSSRLFSLPRVRERTWHAIRIQQRPGPQNLTKLRGSNYKSDPTVFSLHRLASNQTSRPCNRAKEFSPVKEDKTDVSLRHRDGDAAG